MLKSWDSRAVWRWVNLTMSPDLFAWHCMGKRSFPDWSLRLSCMCYDVVTTLWRSNVFVRRKPVIKRRYFKVLAAFSVALWLESGKYARITITHVCLFPCINTCGFLGRCLNTWHYSPMFKQLPRDPLNVNAWKTCVVPIYTIYACIRCLEVGYVLEWNSIHG